MMMKMKNRSHRHEIVLGLDNSKYKNCLSMMMLICIKQQLSNIWRSIYEKVKQHWGWVERRVAYKKSVYFVVPLMIPTSSWCESRFNIFFVPWWISSYFFCEWWKNKFFSSRFRGFWNSDLRTDLFNLCSKNGMCQIVNRKSNLFK